MKPRSQLAYHSSSKKPGVRISHKFVISMFCARVIKMVFISVKLPSGGPVTRQSKLNFQYDMSPSSSIWQLLGS